MTILHINKRSGLNRSDLLKLAKAEIRKSRKGRGGKRGQVRRVLKNVYFDEAGADRLSALTQYFINKKDEVNDACTIRHITDLLYVALIEGRNPLDIKDDEDELSGRNQWVELSEIIDRQVSDIERNAIRKIIIDSRNSEQPPVERPRFNPANILDDGGYELPETPERLKREQVNQCLEAMMKSVRKPEHDSEEDEFDDIESLFNDDCEGEK